MYFHHRHTIRLQCHDYSSPQTYFVTIGTYKHGCLFGEIINHQFIPNEIGKIIQSVWFSLPNHHSVKLGKFQLMPNHLHCLLHIVRAQRAAPLHFGIKSGSLSCVIRSFKSESSKKIHQMETYFGRIFQRNYYEHIIRDQADLIKCQNYTTNNPQMWLRDRNNPLNLHRFRVK